MPRRALGRLHLSTRRLLRVIDASRPLLCVLAVLFSAAFTVLLYVHFPTFTKEGHGFFEAQPMYVLPSAIVLVHICAATIGIEAYNRIVVPQTPDWLCYGAFSSVFTPVVGWAAFKAFPVVAGPSIDDPIPDPAHTVASGDTIPSLARLKTETAAEHPEDCPLAPCAQSRAAAHAVFSSVWARLAIAAAAMESTSHETLHLFTHHASTLGNGLIVLCTIALAAPDGSTMMPEHARVLGVVTIVVSVLYQIAVFVPMAFTRPPAVILFFCLCFTHDAVNIIGALSPIGTCEGSSCVSMAGYGFTYDVSVTGLAVLGTMTVIIPFFTVASSVGIVVDCYVSTRSVAVAVMTVFTMVAAGGLAVPVLLALFPAIALSVPCLSLVAAVVLGLGPRDPAVAAGRTLLHVFCDEVTAAFARAAAMVGPGSPAESVPLPPLCDSSVLCRGPRAAEIHVLRHSAAQHFDELTFRPVETFNTAGADDFLDAATPPTARSYSSSSVSYVNVFTGAHAPDAAATVAVEVPSAEPLREILVDDLAQQFAVSMAEVAAVLTPHPTPSALPANVRSSPLAYLTGHLAGAEMAASAERQVPLAVFMDEAETAPGSSDEAAPSVITASRGPVATANGSDYCHIDLATETFDDALRGGWRWLLRFAWRRRSFAPLPGHATPGVFVDMWRVSGAFGYAKAFAAWGTLAALLLSRPVLFVAPLLEPAFNTNVPTTAYVCIALRVVCWVGIALLAPSLHRAVCRTAAFSVVNGPEVRVDCTISEAMLGAARCIAAAYEPHLPTVLRRSVPHRVVSHVVIGDAVAPFLPPSALGHVPYD